jgi:hypothetical protein
VAVRSPQIDRRRTQRQHSQAAGFQRRFVGLTGIAGNDRFAGDRFVGVPVDGGDAATVTKILTHVYACPSEVRLAIDDKDQTKLRVTYRQPCALDDNVGVYGGEATGIRLEWLLWSDYCPCRQSGSAFSKTAAALGGDDSVALNQWVDIHCSGPAEIVAGHKEVIDAVVIEVEMVIEINERMDGRINDFCLGRNSATIPAPAMVV